MDSSIDDAWVFLKYEKKHSKREETGAVNLAFRLLKFFKEHEDEEDIKPFQQDIDITPAMPPTQFGDKRLRHESQPEDMSQEEWMSSLTPEQIQQVMYETYGPAMTPPVHSDPFADKREDLDQQLEQRTSHVPPVDTKMISENEPIEE
jgi:hypothetical protein